MSAFPLRRSVKTILEAARKPPSTGCHFRAYGSKIRQFSQSSSRCQRRVAPKDSTSRPNIPRSLSFWSRPRRLYSRHIIAVSSGILSLVLFDIVHPASITPEPASSPELEAQQTESVGGGGELPKFRISEVREHGPSSERPWIICEDKVYDITDWIPAHPGGDVILRAAGGSVEPYWDIFSIHKTKYVREILEQYLVGRLHEDDLVDGRPSQDEIQDPFSADPERDPRMRILTKKPCNAETPGSELADSFLTPTDTFYIRNHMWVPVVEEAEADNHEISIELPSGDSKIYTIGDLKSRFKQHAVTSVLQCSGNRRKDMTDHAKKTNGLQWTVGAIGCAKWEGVRLRDVLEDAGLSLNDPGEDAQHVQLSGMEAYGASIPLASAIDSRGDVLLAFKMNDQPISRDHGFPVRAVVPGHVAARSVKWVSKIVVSDEESNTAWQRRDYKCFGPNETKQDWDRYKAIQHMPVTSAITRITPKTRSAPRLSADSGGGSRSIGAQATDQGHVVELEGYAYSGGGHEIQRVDVSLDGGETWDQAILLQEDAELQLGSKPWCWKRWKYEGTVPSVGGQVMDNGGLPGKTTFVVKATDDAYNTQPETYRSIYNLRGNLATAWHRVDYSLSGKADR